MVIFTLLGGLLRARDSCSEATFYALANEKKSKNRKNLLVFDIDIRASVSYNERANPFKGESSPLGKTDLQNILKRHFQTRGGIRLPRV